MTEAKIVSAIKNYVTSQRGVTGFSLRNEQVADEVDTLRMRMIAEMDAMRMFRKPYQGFVQKIEFTVPASKKIVLPKIYVKADGTHAIEYAGGKNGTTQYRLISGINHANWIDKDEYSLFPVVVINEQELTFKNFGSDDLMMIAVFEDPSDLEDYGYDPGYDSDDGVSDYPIPNAMVDMIIGKTVESYLRTMYRIPPQPNKQVDVPGQNA